MKQNRKQMAANNKKLKKNGFQRNKTRKELAKEAKPEKHVNETKHQSHKDNWQIYVKQTKTKNNAGQKTQH